MGRAVAPLRSARPRTARQDTAAPPRLPAEPRAPHRRRGLRLGLAAPEAPQAWPPARRRPRRRARRRPRCARSDTFVVAMSSAAFCLRRATLRRSRQSKPSSSLTSRSIFARSAAPSCVSPPSATLTPRPSGARDQGVREGSNRNDGRPSAARKADPLGERRILLTELSIREPPENRCQPPPAACASSRRRK